MSSKSENGVRAIELSMMCSFAEGDRGDFIRVVADRCTGCGSCATFCVAGVWKEHGDIFEPVKLESCVECGACWNICPADAIEFDEPPGGTGVRFNYG